MKANKQSGFGTAPVLCIIKPWRQWLFVCFALGSSEDPLSDIIFQSSDVIVAIKEMIGNDSAGFEVLRLEA